MDLVFNAAAYTGQSTVYVKLHLGDPGEAGTGNPAAETTRAAVTFGACDATTGTVTNDSAATWTAVSATEHVTHASLWDASSGGNCLWSGDFEVPQTVTAGDKAVIGVGSLTVSLA